jgi:hypothetical protein
VNKKSRTYLALDSTGLVITLGGSGHATTNADSTIAGLNSASLGQVLLTLLLSDLDLLFLTAATELIGLELVPGLELGPTVFGDIAFRHGVWKLMKEKKSAPQNSK